MHKIVGLTPKAFGQWAVVTGGNSGIGLAHAEILAANGFNLLLSARREAELKIVADDLHRNYGVSVEILATDLGVVGGAEAIIDASAGMDVGVFIGNAGAANPGYIDQAEIGELEKCINVKIRSNLVLSQHFAGHMRGNSRGGILLVSSIGGRQGIPFLANNAAAEAYVLTLAEGLHYELKSAGVTVTALLPGPTATPAFYRMSKNPKKRPKGAMTADAVAYEGLTALVRGKPTHVAGRMNRLMITLMSRRSMTRLMGKMIAGMFDIKPVNAAGRRS